MVTTVPPRDTNTVDASQTTLIYEDRRFLNHETGPHPENADRIRGMAERLRDSGLESQCRRVTWEPISRQRLSATP